MTVLHRSTKKLLAHLLPPICCVLVSASASAQSGDDLFLLQSAVAPNVVLFMDNSDSMNQIEWHPAFDPEKVPDASYCTFSADITEFAARSSSPSRFVPWWMKPRSCRTVRKSDL